MFRCFSLAVLPFLLSCHFSEASHSKDETASRVMVVKAAKQKTGIDWPFAYRQPDFGTKD